MDKLKQLLESARAEAVAQLKQKDAHPSLVAIKTRLDACLDALPAEAPAPAPEAKPAKN